MSTLDPTPLHCPLQGSPNGTSLLSQWTNPGAVLVATSLDWAHWTTRLQDKSARPLVGEQDARTHALCLSNRMKKRVKGEHQKGPPSSHSGPILALLWLSAALIGCAGRPERRNRPPASWLVRPTPVNAGACRS